MSQIHVNAFECARTGKVTEVSIFKAVSILKQTVWAVDGHDSPTMKCTKEIKEHVGKASETKL